MTRRFHIRLTQALSDQERNRRLFLAYCVGLIAGYVIITAVEALPGFPLGGPGDFKAFYAAAQIIRTGNAPRLYDLGLQAEVQQALLAAQGWTYPDGLLAYAYPPFFTLAFIPLSLIPLAWAFPIWNLLNIVLIVISVKLLLNHQQGCTIKDFVLACLVVFAFFPVFQALSLGQSSPLILFVLTLSYLALKRERDYLAGALLALALVKPQLVLVIAAVLLFQRRWRAVLTFSITALVLVLISYIIVGGDGFQSYLDLVRQTSTWKGMHGIYPTLMANLRGTVYRAEQLLSAWFGNELSPTLLGAVTLLLSLPVFAWLLYVWRGPWKPASPAFELRFAFTVLVALLLSPHLYGQDLALLVLVASMLLHFSERADRAAIAHRRIAISHVAILVAALAMGYVLRAQVFAILLVLFMFILHRELRGGYLRPSEV